MNKFFSVIQTALFSVVAVLSLLYTIGCIAAEGWQSCSFALVLLTALSVLLVVVSVRELHKEDNL